MKKKLLLTLAIVIFALIAAPAYAADTDGDGLLDSVETNTGIYVSPTDTGTDPLVADTDGDGAGDWYEVTASYTDPTDSGD